MAYWSIEEGRVDPEVLFRELPKHFPDATTILFEGTSIAPDVKRCLRENLESGPHLPGRQTLWPEAELFRCKFSAGLCVTLAALSKNHAEPELCDHLYLYRGDDPLLEFPDFCANEIFLPGSAPEAAVSSFANVFGLGYERRYDG